MEKRFNLGGIQRQYISGDTSTDQCYSSVADLEIYYTYIYIYIYIYTLCISHLKIYIYIYIYKYVLFVYICIRLFTQ